MRPPGGGTEPDTAGDTAGGNEEITARCHLRVATYTS